MPQLKTRSLSFELLTRISALYQAQVIDEQTKNEMAQLTSEGLKDHFQTLYRYLGSIEKSHSLIDEMKDLIIF